MQVSRLLDYASVVFERERKPDVPKFGRFGQCMSVSAVRSVAMRAKSPTTERFIAAFDARTSNWQARRIH